MTEEQKKIAPRVFDLYDEYCHGRITRREFLNRAAAMTIGGVSALWMAQALLPRYADAQTISFTDSRMRGTYVEYPSPGGTSGEVRGYLVQPAGDGPFPAVLIIHENRGLNPHIEDVARRAGVADACIALQEAHGADVNILLFCAWAGCNGVRLDRAQIEAACGAVRGWHEEVVRPLRSVRRRLKSPLDGSPPSSGEASAVRGGPHKSSHTDTPTRTSPTVSNGPASVPGTK